MKLTCKINIKFIILAKVALEGLWS